MVPNGPKNHSKESQKGSHWKELNLQSPGGNVRTMVSCKWIYDFHDCRGARKASCAALCAHYFSTCFSAPLSFDCNPIWAPKGVPGKDPRRTHEPLVTFPTRVLGGAPREPRLTKTHPKTTTKKSSLSAAYALGIAAWARVRSKPR